MRTQVQNYIKDLHNRVTDVVANVDKIVTFQEDKWVVESGNGGGVTRVFENGEVFEKGGVNFSAIESVLSETLAKRLNTEPTRFFATGVSVVIHPKSPLVPTAHCNYRYFEQYDKNGEVTKAWFGGGADLTPYYPYLEDIQHFHRTLKNACDKHDKQFYPRFKKWCDEYFFLPHRNETRGAGGIFFDYLKDSPQKIFAFQKSVGDAFVNAYFPIIERRKMLPYSDKEREFQLYRRGRYVEFNLLFDRGTRFGIETNGRVESILMSLPSVVRWEYNYKPKPNTRENMIYKCLKPRDWLNEKEI